MLRVERRAGEWRTKVFLAPSFRRVPLPGVTGCRLPTCRSLPALEAKKNIKMATQGDISGTLLCPSVRNVAEAVRSEIKRRH